MCTGLEYAGCRVVALIGDHDMVSDHSDALWRDRAGLALVEKPRADISRLEVTCSRSIATSGWGSGEWTCVFTHRPTMSDCADALPS